MPGSRLWISSLMAICLFAATTARAADYLPPPSQPCCGGSWNSNQWGGFYFGGQFGYSYLNSDFSDAWNTGNVLSSSVDSNDYSFGGFVGYNSAVWDPQLVLGIELGYDKPSSLETTAADSNPVIASYKLEDYLTLRGRAGYAFGSFLPYAVLGAAVGRVNYSITDATGLVTGQDNTFPVGLVLGLGMDVSVLPNVFLRGEWEQVIFSPEGGIRSNINTARVGIGFRF
ncbi:MAG: outer membrane beta-barrel protein [Pseudolabrys sp.]|jgi:outer membrane immunogenic protein